MKKVGIVIVLLLIANIGFSNELNRSFKAGNEITFNLPSEWVSIPEQVISKINKGKPRKQQWDYAYQADNSGNWFVYPYILVRVSNTGKVPASEFIEYKRPFNETENQKLSKNASGMADNIGITERHFDDNTATYSFTTKANIQGVGLVLFKSALIFTEKGLIEIGCYINDAASKKFMPVFDEILRNIELDTSIKYKTTEESSMLYTLYLKYKYIFNMIIGASIALLILNLVRRKRKKG